MENFIFIQRVVFVVIFDAMHYLPVNVIFLDPPYADSDIYSWIKRENWKSLLNPGGLVIVESGGELFDEPWKVRKYGDTTISILEV